MTQLQAEQFDQFQFDPADGSLRNLNTHEQTTLRPQVASLLTCLLDQAGQVVNRESIVLAIWGQGAVVDFESGLAAIVKELRQSFEQLGGSASMLETIPRRGYRLNFDAVPQTVPSVAANQTAKPIEHSGSNQRRRWYWIGLVLVAVLLISVVLSTLVSNNSAEPSQSLVILPFERYGDLHQAPEHVEYLIADTLLARLWQADLQGLELIGRTSVQAFADRPSVAIAVAEELGADLILEGDLITEAIGWRLEARLLELPSGRVIWSEAVQAGNPGPSIDEIADDLVTSLSNQWQQLQSKP